MPSSASIAKPIALTPGVASDTWSELVAAMPVVIFYRAVREVLRQRAHRQAVLAAFRR